MCRTVFAIAVKLEAIILIAWLWTANILTAHDVPYIPAASCSRWTGRYSGAKRGDAGDVRARGCGFGESGSEELVERAEREERLVY
jgi:hypothetical protein